jgi:hypothetical protein
VIEDGGIPGMATPGASCVRYGASEHLTLALKNLRVKFISDSYGG